jgi:hypothetical protein
MGNPEKTAMNISQGSSRAAASEGDAQPEASLALTWLRRAYSSAYRRGCNYQFTVPARDQDLDILNREIVEAMIAFAEERRQR